MKIISKHLNGLLVLEPAAFADTRGYFMESYKASVFSELGLPTEFLQDNHSVSKKGVIRGMHFQWDKPMGKLIRVTNGRAFFAEADIRPGSPTLGKWFTIELSADNRLMMWVPPGFANGFLALADETVVQYKCTAEWNPSGEGAILWNDNDLAIEWGVAEPIISEKDRCGLTLARWLEMAEARNFSYR